MISENELIKEVLRNMKSTGNIREIKILELTEFYGKVSIEITDLALNLYGVVHGGFLFTLCDNVAALSTLACGTANVTQTANISYIKPVKAGDVIVEAQILHKGAHTVVNQLSILQGNELKVSATFTMFMTGSLSDIHV